MIVVNFYHPENKRLIAKIRAIDRDEAVQRFISSVNQGFCVDANFMGRLPEEELQYLHFDWCVIGEGLPNDEFDWEEQ
jgi:hypothetical protein